MSRVMLDLETLATDANVQGSAVKKMWKSLKQNI